jgi:hydrogenase small subunit
MGVPDYLGWSWKSKAGIRSFVCPAAQSIPDNLSETILYLLYQATGQAPMIPSTKTAAPHGFRSDGTRRLIEPILRARRFATEYGSPKVHRQTRLLGTGGQNATWPKRGWIQRTAAARTRWNLYRLHHAGVPG